MNDPNLKSCGFSAACYAIGRLAVLSGRNLDAGLRHLQRCLELTPGPGDPSHAQVQAQLDLINARQAQPPAAPTPPHR